MAREATDGLYIELDYYTPENYHTYTAEASMISGEYIDNGYIDLDYFQPGEGTGLFVLTCDLTEVVGELKEFAGALSVVASTAPSAVKTVVVDTSLTVTATQSSTVGVIKQGAVALTGAFSPSIGAVAILRPDVFLESSVSFAATAVKTTSNEVILSYLASLDAQAARKRAYDSALSASFDTSTTANSTKPFSAALQSTFTLPSIDINAFKSVSANLSTTSTATIDGKALSERPLVAQNSSSLFAGNPFTPFGSYFHSVSSNSNTDFVVHRDFMPDNDTEWFIEGWFAITGADTYHTLFNLTYESDLSSPTTNIITVLNNNGSPLATLYNDNGVIGFDSVTTPDFSSSFKHFVFAWKPGTGFKMWYDGSELLTDTFTDSLSIRSNEVGRLLIGRRYLSESTYNKQFSLDEWRVVKGVDVLDNYGYSFSNSTITEPTTAFEDTSQTQILLHFENNLDDDFIPGLAEANLNATASVSAIIGFVKQFASTVSSAFSVSASGELIIDGNATLDSAATVDATIGSIKTFGAALTNAFTPSIDANAIIRPDVFLESAFSSTVDAIRNIGPITASLSSNVSVTADVDRTLGEIELGIHAGAFSVSVDPVKTVSANSSLAVQGSLTVDFDKFRSGEASFVTSSNLSVTAQAFPGFIETLSSAASADFGNNTLVVPEYNWLPRRSVFHFDDPYTDLVRTEGVTGSIASTITGFGEGLGDNEGSNCGILYFNATERSVSVQRTTGRYNTNIDTDDFTFDMYVALYGETNGFHRLVKFEDSANNFEFGYTYDFSYGVNEEERFNFIINENGSNAYTYNLTVNTGDGNQEYEDDYYRKIGVTQNGVYEPIRWQYFRIERINGNLAVKWQNIGLDAGPTTIISDSGYNTDFGSGFIVGGSGIAPTLVDLVALQIETPDFNFFGVKPSIPVFYQPYDSAGAILNNKFEFFIDAQFVVFGASDPTAQFTQSTDANRLRDPEQTDIPFTASVVEVEPVIRASAEATLNNQFNTVCNAVKTTVTGSSLVVTATQNTDNVRAKLFEPSLSSAFTLPDVAYEFFRGLAISAEVEATVEAEPLRIKQLGASLTGAFSPSIDANAILRPDVFLEVEATITEVEPVIFAGAQSTNNQVTTTLVCDAVKTTDVTQDLASAFAVNANIFSIIQFESALTVAVTSDITFIRNRFASSALDLSVTTQITPNRQRNLIIQLNTAVSLQAAPQLLVEAGADITAQFEDTFVVTRLRKAEADLSVFGFSVTVGDIINIDPFRQLIVPSETRFIKVSQETRRVVVPSETRILEV